MLEVLEGALAARVIEELPNAVGRYQFTHALIQETLSGELSLPIHPRADSGDPLGGAFHHPACAFACPHSRGPGEAIWR